jgi:hypothetical protein
MSSFVSPSLGKRGADWVGEGRGDRVSSTPGPAEDDRQERLRTLTASPCAVREMIEKTKAKRRIVTRIRRMIAAV